MLRAVGVVLRRYFAGMTGSRVRRSLTERVVDTYAAMPLAYHRSRPTGELLAHAEADVQAATEVIHPLPWSLAVVLLILFAGIALLVADPVLAGVAWVVLPALAVLNRRFSTKIEGPAARAQETIGELSSVAHESIDGGLIVKVLGRQDAEVTRLAEKARALRDERIRVGRLRAAFDPAFEALPSLGIVVLLLLGSWRVSTHAISVGTLVQFVALFQLTAGPIQMIGHVLSDVPRSVVGYARLQEVYDEPVPMQAARGGTPLPDGPLPVTARGVAFSYDGRTRVLDGVSFELGANESVAVVGPTGAGKSTLVHLLARLADPDEGAIAMGGVDLRNADPESMRRTVAVVFQENFLFAESVRQNIALGLDVPDEELRRAARLARADGFIEAMPNGYDTVVGERGVTLSGGQRQRVALARALIRNPRVMILDDATSAIDPVIEQEILAGLRRELHTTLVVVAYRVSTIALADRVLFLMDGRVAAEGTHEDLLGHPPYRAMLRAFQQQVRGGSSLVRSTGR
jgi:ABC-type multidrug transport system fused ATPase/permease subunit